LNKKFRYFIFSSLLLLISLFFSFALVLGVGEIYYYSTHRINYKNELQKPTIFSKSTFLFDHMIGSAFDYHEYLPFRLIPGQYRIGFRKEKKITINSLGYRGKEFKQEKGDQLRVLFIGDSCTYGYGVDNEYTIPRLVEKELCAEFPDIEVINAGFHGFTPQHYDLYLRMEGYALKPNVVIMVIYPGNDFEDFMYSIVEKTGKDGRPEIIDGLFYYDEGKNYYKTLPLFLYHIPVLDRSYLWYIMLKTLHEYRFRNLHPDSPTSVERRAFVEKPVNDILRDTAERNIALQAWVVVGKNFIEKRKARADPLSIRELADHMLLLEILSKAGVSFVDFADNLQMHNPKEICSFGEHLDEIHINEKGNAIVAKVGSEKLRVLLRKNRSRIF